MKLVIRRLLAFGLDYLVIVGYLVVLAVVSLAIMASGLRGAFSAAWATAWSAEAMGFLMLTLPVVVYFAILESSKSGATLGKHALRLRVRGLAGQRLNPWRSLLRSGVKFLPWEMAHFTIWHFVYATNAHAQPPPWTTISLTGVYALVAANLVTLVVGKTHRTIYDRVAGSIVLLVGDGAGEKADTSLRMMHGPGP
jgi:uncharacterized RDD family membrane protein YckC